MSLVLDCVTTVIICALFYLMFYNKFDVRKDHFALRVTAVVFINVVKAATLPLRIPLLNFISFCIVYFVMFIAIYKCSLKTAIIYSSLYILIAFVSDAMSVFITSSIQDNTINEIVVNYNWKQYIWNWIILLFLSRICVLFIRSNENIKVKWREIAFYILLLAFEITFFFIVFDKIQDYFSGQFLIFVMTGFFVLDICVVYILRKISMLRDTEQKYRLMEQQENLQLQMYRELNKKYDAAREIAHDINRHISSLEALVNSDHNKQAEQYLSDLTKAAERLKPVIKNQNPMLAIILNTAADRCEKKNIPLKLNVEDFPIEFISDIDMTTIFSNLFDNAIEACLELSPARRYINFVLKKQIGLIVINMTNSCVDMPETSIRPGRSAKSNHSGIGLLNIKKAVDKYNGVFSTSCEGNRFCASVTFGENG